MDRASGAPSVRTYLLGALTLAVALAVAGILAARHLMGESVRPTLAIGTACVVGLVVAAAIVGSTRRA